MLLHEKIRKWRGERGLKQAAVALAMGIRQSSYSQIEGGHTRITDAHKKKLSKIFGIPLEMFHNDEEFGKEAYLALQKELEHERALCAELRKELELYKKIVEMYEGKGKK